MTRKIFDKIPASMTTYRGMIYAIEIEVQREEQIDKVSFISLRNSLIVLGSIEVDDSTHEAGVSCDITFGSAISNQTNQLASMHDL
jgi:hypothetical protein